MSMNPRLLVPRASVFNPKSIAGLELWLDASDESKITQVTGVSVWADKSGFGRNATQGDGNKQPIYTNTLNGRKIVTFQGNDDTLEIANVAAFNGAAVTYILVCRQASAANQGVLYKASGGGVNGYIFRFRTGTEIWSYQANDSVAQTLSSISNDNTAWSIYTTTLQASAQSAHRNGTSIATATASRTYEDTGQIWLGSRRNIGEFLVGDIAEVLLYSRAITASERQRIERYLGGKWGITVA